MEWLSEPWMGPLPFGWEDVHGITIPDCSAPANLHVLAALVGINGGFRVVGWGCISNGGIYGRLGLEQGEALCLIQMAHFLEGMNAGRERPEEVEEVVAALKREHDRVRALREAVGFCGDAEGSR